MRLVTEVLPFALGAAISPLLLMVATLALASPPKAKAKAWAMVAGAGVALAAYTALFLVAGSKLPKHRAPNVADGITFLAFALLLVLLATRQLRRRRVGEQGPGLMAKLGQAKPRAFARAGLLAMAANFSSLALYLPGLRMVQRSHAASATQAAAVGLLFALTMAPCLFPVLAASLLGRRADAPLARVNRLVGDHAGDISITIELIFAVLLTWKGVGSF